jgi:hypothetical protein
MITLDEILKDYEKPEPLSEEQEMQIKDEASNHLLNYLCGDGDPCHLYNYYDCIDKIS